MIAGELAAGNIFIRPNLLAKAGDRVPGHVHNFDHVTIFFRGSFHVRASRAFRQFACPDCGKVFETRAPLPPACPSCGSTANKPKTGEREELVAEKDFAAGSWCLIKADVEHAITALEDGSEFWCVYAHRDAQGRVTQQFTGWDEAYR